MIRHSLKASGRLFSIVLKSMSYSTTAERTVEVEKVGKIVLIGINRPQKRNAVNPETAEQLHQAFKQFDDDKDSLVAILHGKDGNFCAGFDLEALTTSPEKCVRGDPQQSDIGPMGPSRLLTSKPIIAAVSGYAVAGGMELALMCDLRVMEESAIMGIFCRRFGVPLIDGGTVRLPKLIGLSRALDLILTGRPVGAKEALEMGLANRVVATGTALGQSLKLAQEIAKFPQQCMNVDRRSAYYSTYDAESWDAAMQYEFQNGMKVIQDEAVPGAASFVKGIGKHGSFNINKPSKL
ncbi:hypothetical protein ACJMK2_000570 [Sinanodonta woodiana]|uniref:Uncharacterized protein n=1 Tax=Sinanodonta woodiana TaxID=1069815 RepID=A0ABD3XRF9_SINWO